MQDCFGIEGTMPGGAADGVCTRCYIRQRRSAGKSVVYFTATSPSLLSGVNKTANLVMWERRVLLALCSILYRGRHFV